MKELIITAAVAIAAVAANAASINWSQGTTQYSIPGAAVAAGLSGGVYFVGTTSADKAKGKITNTYAILTLTHGTKGDEGYWTETQVFDFSWNNTSKGTKTGINFENVVIDSKGDSAAYALMIFGKITDGKGSTHDVRFPATQTGVFNYSAASSTLSTAASTAWYIGPEPTSGILLLLGVAGLALRRRRA